MLTPKDVAVLNSIAHDLARRNFGGEASVERQSMGTARLRIVRRDRRGRSLYSERDIASCSFGDASREITLQIESAAAP